MKTFIRYKKRFFRKYKVGCKYWINIDDIIVPSYFKKNPVGSGKWKHKLEYWYKTGEFESPIKLNKDFVLVDGFSSAKIAYLKGIKKVPVYFIN